MSIKTTKIIVIDEKTEIDSPTVEIVSYLVYPNQKSIEVNALFTSGKTVLHRSIGIFKYSSDWTFSELETFLSNYLTTKEKKLNEQLSK